MLNKMTYRQKTIQSMAFYLKKRYTSITKLDAIKVLKEIWSFAEVSDMITAYKLAYE